MSFFKKSYKPYVQSRPRPWYKLMWSLVQISWYVCVRNKRFKMLQSLPGDGFFTPPTGTDVIDHIAFIVKANAVDLIIDRKNFKKFLKAVLIKKSVTSNTLIGDVAKNPVFCTIEEFKDNKYPSAIKL